MIRAALLICCIFLVLSAAFAQEPVPLPKEIRGSEHPELIPDREALMILFLTLSDAPSAFPLDSRRKFLSDGGLGLSDNQTIMAAANRFRLAYTSIIADLKLAKAANGAKSLSTTTKNRMDALVARGWAALEDSRQTLQTSLSPAGALKLQSLLNTNIKPKMVWVPGK